jgi:hypothetical protein
MTFSGYPILLIYCLILPLTGKLVMIHPVGRSLSWKSARGLLGKFRAHRLPFDESAT